MQLAFLLATVNKNVLISVCSESLPHLKRGAMRDFFNFLKFNDLYDSRCHNKSDNSYTVGTSTIEFFGIESATKVHGAGRHYLIVNEIQNISYDTFFQLSMRTERRVYADYNPVRRFWVDTEYLENPNFKDKCDLIKSTLFDNDFCPANVKDQILTRSLTDLNYKRVYLDGETGTLEGVVYPKWNIVPPEIPHEFTLIGLGLDWGFSNDPLAVTAIYKSQNRLIWKELIHETGWVNTKLIERLKEFGFGVPGHENYQIPVICDSAEPKSIQDLFDAGINAIPISDKRIVQGVKKVQEFEINVTEDSFNLKDELGSYTWAKNKNGDSTELPIDINNHHLDGVRYVIVELLGKPKSETTSMVF
jgi:phage terminase large subunit